MEYFDTFPYTFDVTFICYAHSVIILTIQSISRFSRSRMRLKKNIELIKIGKSLVTLYRSFAVEMKLNTFKRTIPTNGRLKCERLKAYITIKPLPTKWVSIVFSSVKTSWRPFWHQ